MGVFWRRNLILTKMHIWEVKQNITFMLWNMWKNFFIVKRYKKNQQIMPKSNESILLFCFEFQKVKNFQKYRDIWVSMQISHFFIFSNLRIVHKFPQTEFAPFAPVSSLSLAYWFQLSYRGFFRFRLFKCPLMPSEVSSGIKLIWVC